MMRSRATFAALTTAVLALAQFVGSTRLIDNAVLIADDFHRGLLEELVQRTHS